MHLFSPSAPLQKVASFAFVVHHVAPKLMGTLSSHVGGGAHGVAAPHVFLHFFLIFLHAFFVIVSVSLQTPKAASQSSLQASRSAELLHGGGAGEGGGDATGTGAVGDGGGDATAAGAGGGGGGDATNEGH